MSDECEVAEIVIVVSEEYRHIFEDHVAKRGGAPTIKYASGGKERQNSVENGLAEITSEYVAVHDAARPLVTPAEVEKVVGDAKKYGAALLAVQTKATIKEAVAGDAEDKMVSKTPDRELLWEAHTPQVIRSDLLRDGFSNATKLNLAVTDDVSVVEALGEPVKLTQGEYTNIKVTTPEDIAVAETILRGRGFSEGAAADGKPPASGGRVARRLWPRTSRGPERSCLCSSWEVLGLIGLAFAHPPALRLAIR
eukprot:CAMPEP_0171182690 /NCGR_PEP_ID=MMETSP0790-20130122/14898_1 /TAXON_ID=2925 /ORGANISM="Alexandrium catenella, Strain OF101" /LENGTH=251 /DNA_ID=CAMNT_0011647653 /DNA_START=1 /DNA_END=753 /DNA_ORIENTATION=+